MRLAWATDLHLNFVSEAHAIRLCGRMLEAGVDGLLLGGDLTEAPLLEPCLTLLEKHLGLPIWFVLGNHDYYGGSIGEVRARLGVFPRFTDHLHYLSAGGVVRLSEHTALVGHDGWGDCRSGNAESSRVLLNDFLHIAELAGLSPGARRLALQRLGQAAAEHIDNLLGQALAQAAHVVVLTHVPPFPEACVYDGQKSGEDWLPYFCNAAVGPILLKHARAHPDRRILVLAGHTHQAINLEVLPNLRVRVGEAEYGRPRYQAVFRLP